MRHCPFAGCHRCIPTAHFACRHHWFSMPLDLRKQADAAYHEYLAHQISITTLRKRQRAIVDTTEGKDQCT